jgi:hypothetical protein
LLKTPAYFYYPAQLAAYAAHPVRWQWAYAVWTVGLICLWPAFLAIVSLISRSRPWLGRVTGALAFTGLMVNAFYEGVNHLAFELVKVHGVGLATDFVARTYGWFSLPYALTWTDNLAWILLAVGAWRIRLIGPLPALGIAFMATHASGVLKGYNPLGVTADLLLLAAFTAVAIRLVRARPEQ